MQKKLLKICFALLIIVSLFLSPKFTKEIHAISNFSDSFERPDDTTLGTNWELFYGSLPSGIQNNKAYIESGAGGIWGLYKVVGLNIQDQDVNVTLTHQDGDTTLLARVIDLNNRIAVNYYQSGTLQIYEVHNGNYRLIPNTAPNAVIGATYTFRVRLVGNNIKVWIDDNLYADDTLNFVTSGSAGIGASDGYTKVFFDNFIVQDLNAPTETPTTEPTTLPTELPTSTPTQVPTTTPTITPTSTPTTEPTITPTATPLFPVLSVPSLKQYSVPWKNKIYDHTRSTIEEFGCALTSAVMVLQYHGHIVLPDALNNWLKGQEDGYIRNGLINWLAVSRYTKQRDSNSSPTLEYKRLEPTNENLDNELANNRPAILKEDGHFVVATGKNDTTYLINDPGYSNRNTLESYGNNFLAINSYTPTHSDLSYMMFVVDSDVSLTVLDAKGNTVNTTAHIEEPIKSIKDPNKKSGETVKVVLLEKPQNGKYELKVTGPKGSYNLESYLYNVNGKVTKNEFNGKLTGNDTDKFNISFEGKLKIKEEEKNKNNHYDWYYFFKHFKKWW